MTHLQSDSFRWTSDNSGSWLCIKCSQPQKILDRLQPGKQYDIEIKQHRERRSLDANAYFHVLCGKIAEEMGIGMEEEKTALVVEYGVPMRDNDGGMVGFKLPIGVDVNRIYRYVRCFDQRVENGKTFNCFIVLKHTHEMDSKEMSRLIDGTIYTAKELGIETLPPEKLKALEGYE